MTAALAVAVTFAFALNHGDIIVVAAALLFAVTAGRSGYRRVMHILLLALGACLFYTLIGSADSANRAADAVYLLLPVELILRFLWK